VNKIQALWHKLIGLPESSAQVMQRDKWTRDIVRIMFFVVLVSMAAILLGVISRKFLFSETIPIYIIFAATAVAYLCSQKNGWRWARFLPVLICLFTGFFFSYGTGFRGTGLFYTLAIMLTSMLFGVRPSWFVVLVSIAGYTLIGSGFRAVIISLELPAIITTSSLLIGTTFLLSYFNNSLSRVISDLTSGNQKLQQEITLRRQAEVIGEKQKSLYTRLAENTTDLVCEMGLNGTLNYISPSYLTTLGYTPELLVGKIAYDIVHPDDLQQALDIAEQIRLSRLPNRVRLRILHADGHYIHMETSGSPLLNEEKEVFGYILSSRDITQQVIAEETLIESETKFRNIIEATPLGIHMYTVNEENELIFSGYNPAACNILGMDHAPLVGKPILEVFPSLSGTELPDAYRATALSGSQWKKNQFAYLGEDLHGVFEVQTFQYSPGKMVAIFEDITSRIMAEEALHSSQEMFSKAFNTSPDAININRLSDGAYININQGFTNIMGYSREDVIGETSLKLEIWVNPADRAALVKGLLENGEVNNLEATFRSKDGSTRIGLMSARVIEINHEQCILSITRDISERKKAETDLKLAHTQLEQAYSATLEGWVRALEMREHETADHSRRVVELTVAMAKRLGIRGLSLLHTQRGALLHDIGKIGVPDNILLKPGPLSAEEWIIMRYHPTYSRNLLQDIAYLIPAMDIPYCHHERWDGTGYPRGISGEEIPLTARIFSVIDVYDALLSNRPYRPAWSMPDVKKYLIDQKGQQFDPNIVDEFLTYIEEKQV